MYKMTLSVMLCLILIGIVCLFLVNLQMKNDRINDILMSELQLPTKKVDKGKDLRYKYY